MWNGVAMMAFLLLLLATLAGCGKKEVARPREAQSSHEFPGLADEVAPLSPKAMVREDRLVPFRDEARSTAEVTKVDLEPRPVVDTAPGENWGTETATAETMAQLRRLIDSPDSVASIVAPGFEASALVPSELSTVFEDGETTVRRMRGEESLKTSVRDVSGFTEALEAMWRPFRGAAPRVEWKPVAIQTDGSGDQFTTVVLLEISGKSAGEEALREIHATWRCRWQGAIPPLLQGIQLEAWEESVTQSGTPWFEDITEATLARVPLAKVQTLTGIEYWSERITRYGDMYLTGHHGLAVGDVNGDGREDLYVCDGGSLPNRLYIQQPDGRVRDFSAEAGVDFLEDSRGALLIDLDNDGDQDLVVATVAMIVLAENDGTGSYSLRGGHMGAPYPGSISAADPDGDGDLDLYVCVYESDHAGDARGFAARTPVPFHDAENGGRNVLLENLGDFQFADRTEAFGLEANNTRWSFTAAWEDYDRDGDPDLYVANDFGRNNLYRNDGGRFVDVALAAGVEDMAAGMSVAWGDYNRDGHADLYVGNMFSSAGRRISYQRLFDEDSSPGALAGKQRMARGNTLFAARGDATGAFDDVSESAGVVMGRWAWSSAFADLNNDGWEDLLVANGYLTNRREDDL